MPPPDQIDRSRALLEHLVERCSAPSAQPSPPRGEGASDGVAGRDSAVSHMRGDVVGVDRDALFSWLGSPQVVTSDGAVLSWHNPDKPGFAYPEAAAIWLAWAAWRDQRGEEVQPLDRCALVARRLSQELAEGHGVGKAGRVFLFDTCLAVDGLLLATAILGSPMPGRKSLARVADRLEAFIHAGEVVCTSPDAPPRWSERAGPFQLRAVAALRRAARVSRDPRWSDLAEALSARVAGREDYTHAWLYELEGRARLGQDVGEALDELAALGARAGGLTAWRGGQGALRADVMAQAVRLWVDFGARSGGGTPTPALPRRGGGGRPGGQYEMDVQATLRGLSALQGASGAVRYEPGSPDRNVWCSLFADQAAAWAQDGARDEDWI